MGKKTTLRGEKNILYLLPHSIATPAYMHMYTHLLPCEPRKCSAFNSKVRGTIWQILEGKNSREAGNCSLQAQVFFIRHKRQRLAQIDTFRHNKSLVKLPCPQSLQVQALPFLSTVQKLCVGMMHYSKKKKTKQMTKPCKVQKENKT